MSTAERPLRKDAERNRQRILAAAVEVFGERGLGVSLDDIARHAGVGVGTVYRRFPDKSQLVDAVFEDRIAGMVRLAEEGLAIEDPWDGLVHFLRGGVELQCGDRALRELLFSACDGLERVASARDRIAPLAGALLARAQEAGVVRSDVSRLDLPMLQIMAVSVVEFGGEAAPELWRRAHTVLLDGLRPAREGVTPLPGAPLDDDAIAQAMRDWHASSRH